MRVQTIGPGPHPDFSIQGSVVTVGELAIDCAQRQSDKTEIIDLRAQGGAVTEGGEGHQVASIHIPPRRYELVEVETDPAGENDEEEGTPQERVALPLDSNQVLVTIWTR